MAGVRITPKLKNVEVVRDHIVRLNYADGVSAEVDLGYVLNLGPVFDELRNPGVFNRIRTSREANTVVWPCGADIAPETLYEISRRAAADSS